MLVQRSETGLKKNRAEVPCGNRSSVRAQATGEQRATSVCVCVCVISVVRWMLAVGVRWYGAGDKAVSEGC